MCALVFVWFWCLCCGCVSVVCCGVLVCVLLIYVTCLVCCVLVFVWCWCSLVLVGFDVCVFSVMYVCVHWCVHVESFVLDCVAVLMFVAVCMC